MSTRSESYLRHKYERAKEAATTWYQKYQDLQEQIDELKEENRDLKREKEERPDEDFTEELEAENKQLRHEVRKLRKDLHDCKDRVAKLDRERLLSDGKIQQLEDAKKDLRERYNDLKQDFRESQRWNRNTVSRAD
uniref:Uncharacterized protein n=1 Tax=viral metagenome TaxID=1070528 RepID=A0A6C0EM78_9ZZZZ